MLRARLTYANITATLALVVAVGGGGTAYALATNSVSSRHIVDGAVKNRDVAKRSISASRLRVGAVTGLRIRDHSIRDVDLAAIPGVAAAGVNVGPDGVVYGAFNRRGGTPSGSKYGTGLYSVLLPGHTPTWSTTHVAVTPTLPAGRMCGWNLDAEHAVDVWCTDKDGTLVDTGFTMLVFQR